MKIMENKFSLDKSKKVFPIILMVVGLGIMVAQLITRQNIVGLVSLLYCCIMSAVILLSLIIKKKVYLPMVLGYAFSFIGLYLFHVIWGADAGFGAFCSGLAGWSSAENPLFTGEGSIFTRLAGNFLLGLPAIASLLGLVLVAKKNGIKSCAKGALSAVLSVLLMASSVLAVLTGNLRTKPVTDRLWDGHDDYLDGVDKAKSNNPNVLFILMDDMGYADTSLNGAIYDTPNMDRIG
jgi:hypothetical protein